MSSGSRLGVRDLPPGAVAAAPARYGTFTAFAEQLPADALVLADRRVLRLHPVVRRALRGHRVIALAAGEATKQLATVQRLAQATLDVPRGAPLLALGGGTIGDLATVYAHLHKRGLRLVHCPTTLLAAVDSSVGGKGAVNVAGVKNALGVFHDAAATWLCAELFATLSESQHREGRLEAWKVALTDARTFAAWTKAPPADLDLLRTARALKAALVRRDPYERRGVRVLLNFGHTFGHVLEGLTAYRLRHGLAVGLGMLCALDVGRAVGVTPRPVAAAVETALPNGNAARRRLARAFAGADAAALTRLLRADKKGHDRGAVNMVLLRRPGALVVRAVPLRRLLRLLPAWREARTP
jgi:3-dehydroquinate synthase